MRAARRVALAACALAGAASPPPDPAACSARASCVADLNAFFAAAAANATLVLRPGDYALAAAGGPRVLLAAPTQDNILVDGTGAVFNLSGLAGLLAIGAVRNFTLAGLTVDSVRAPFTLGVVVASTPNSTELAVDEAVYPLGPAALAAFPFLAGADRAVGYDVATMGPSVGGVDLAAAGAPWPLAALGGGRARLDGVGVAFAAGDALLLRHGDSAPVFSATGARALTLRGVTVHAAPGIGVLTNGCTDVTLDGVRLARSRGRHATVTAGATHFANSRGGALVMRGCAFEGAGDDGANPANAYQELEPGGIAADRRSATVGAGGAAAPSVARAGDALAFFSRRTFAALGAGVAARVAGSTIFFAAPLPAGVREWDLVQSAGNAPDSFLVDGCSFSGNRARGGLFKASNTLIRNSNFSRTAMAAVQVDPDAGCRWFEGAPVVNFTMEGCVVDHVNAQLGPRIAGSADVWVTNCVPAWSAAGAPLVHGAPYAATPQNANVTIRGCTFRQGAGGQPAVSLIATTGVLLEDNVVEWDGAARPNASFVGAGVRGAVLRGNVCGGGPCATAGL